MPSFVLRCFLLLCIPLALAACDAGRTDLTENPPVDDPTPVDPLEGSCSARIDGVGFVADDASARVDANGDLNFSCENGDIELLFRVQPSSTGPATITLGEPGNRAQYRVGPNVSVTVEGPGGESAGTLTLDTFDSERVEGTFNFTVPGFQEGDPEFRITAGTFDIELP